MHALLIQAAHLKAVRVSPRTVWIFIELIDADGRTGLGEASLESNHLAVATAFEHLRPSLQASQFGNAADLGRWVRAHLTHRADLAHAAALSAIEQALQDLLAQVAGRSLHACLGSPRRSRVALYANINRGTTSRSAEQFAQRALEAASRGFAGVKIAPFDGVTPDGAGSRGAIDLALARIAAVRAALNGQRSHCSLMVDCHWRFSELTAVDMVHELAALGVTWYECPVAETPEHYPLIARLRRLANARGIRLAGAETMVGLEGFRPILEAGLYDVVMPDVKYAGGLEQTLRIAEFAATHGTDCSPHNPTGPICHAHSLHVAALIDRMPMLELQYGETPLFEQLANGGLPPYQDGTSALPEGPGLGVKLAPSYLDHLEITT